MLGSLLSVVQVERYQAALGTLFPDGGESFEGHFVGELLQPAEWTSEGELLLSLRGRGLNRSRCWWVDCGSGRLFHLSLTDFDVGE